MDNAVTICRSTKPYHDEQPISPLNQGGNSLLNITTDSKNKKLKNWGCFSGVIVLTGYGQIIIGYKKEEEAKSTTTEEGRKDII